MRISVLCHFVCDAHGTLPPWILKQGGLESAGLFEYFYNFDRILDFWRLLDFFDLFGFFFGNSFKVTIKIY